MPSVSEVRLNYAFQKVIEFSVTSESESNRVMTRRWRDGEPSEEDGDRADNAGVERVGFGRVHRVCEELFVQRCEFDGVERVSVDESSGVERWRLLF